jgi:hypothetical protein
MDKITHIRALSREATLLSDGWPLACAAGSGPSVVFASDSSAAYLFPCAASPSAAWAAASRAIGTRNGEQLT